MGIGVLGPLAVDGQAAALAPRDRVILVALAVRPGQVVSTDQLAEALWGERPPASWRQVIPGCVMRLRGRLGSAAIETMPRGYRLALPLADVDSQRFEQLVRRGRELLALGESERAAYVLGGALSLWHGRALADVEEWEPARIEAMRLEEIRLDAEEWRLDATLRAGQHREAVAEARRQVAEAPLRERRWELLALAEYRSGRQGEALRTLHRARSTLATELGLDPGPDLAALEQAILRQDSALSGTAAPPAPSAICPYRGLVAYDVDDAELYFGRDGDIAICLRTLREVGVLAIVGPSGSGKSSLVRAGLAAGLQREGQRVLVVTPGAGIGDAIAALPATETPTLIVDQCEAAVTPSANPDMRRQFFDALVDHARRAPLVVAWRADRFGDVAEQHDFARLLQRNVFLVGAMSEPELRAAITGPAQQAGLLIEPGLVDLLVQDVKGEPGALPMLSHALRETWLLREGRMLTVDGYRASGGVRGAVAQTAEQVYASLDDTQQALLRDLMLRLITVSPTGQPARSAMPRRIVVPDAQRQQLVDRLVDARLVIVDEADVEIAHEALAREWPRLRGWLDEDVEGQRILRHLSAAADAWDAMGRPEGELYRGGRLAAALEWRIRAMPDLNPVEDDFLDASAVIAEAARRADEEQASHRERVNRRLRRALGAVVVLLVGALAAGAIAFQQGQRASREERDAALQALVSRADALRRTRRDVAALLAIEAHRLAPSTATESVLFGTFTASPGVERIVHLTAGRFEVGAIVRDSTSVALLDERAAVHLVAIESGVEQAVLESPYEEEAVSFVALSPDGRYLAVVSFGVTRFGDFADDTHDVLTVWDLDTRGRRWPDVRLPFHPGAVAFSPDGTLIAVSGGGSAEVQIHDAATGTLRRIIDPLPRPADAFLLVTTAGIAFTPAGELVVGSEAGPIRFIDPTTGEERTRIEGPPMTSHYILRLFDGGESLLTAGIGGVMRYELASGSGEWPAPAPVGCTSVAVVELIGAVLCDDGSGRVLGLDLETGAEIGRRFESGQGTVTDLLVSPDGATLIQVLSTGAYVQWRLDGGGPISALVPGTEQASIAGFGPGDALVIDSPPPEAQPSPRVVDAVDGDVRDRLDGAVAAVLTDDPRVAIVTFGDGTIRRYDLDEQAWVGEAIDVGFVPEGVSSTGAHAVAWREGNLIAVDFDGADVTPLIDSEAAINQALLTDARELLTLEGFNNLLVRRDPRNGEPIGAPVPGFDSIAAAAGVVVATTTDGQVVELDPRRLATVGGPFAGITGPADAVAISRDGSQLMVLGADKGLRIHDFTSRLQLGDEIFVGMRGGTVAFAPDGARAAVSTNHGVVIWNLDPDAWVDAACALAGRNLTEPEWDQYIGDLAGYRATCPQYVVAA